MEQFYTLLTDIGKAKIANATALQTKVKFTKILVGDSNGSYYEPTETQTKLKNKVWEGGIGNISIDKDNPNWIILESVIPSSVGGFTIREIGIEDSEGDLVVVAKYPQTYKPKIQDGSTKDLIIKTILEVTNVDSITLKVDPTIVLTTKKDLIDSQKNLEEKLNKKYMQTSKEFIKYNDAQTYFTFYVDEKEGNDVCSNFPNDNHVFKTFNAAAKHCKRVCNHFGTYCNIDLRTDSHADTIFLERTKIKINGNGHTIKSEYGTNTWYIEEGYLEAKNVKIHCQQFNITRGSIALDEVEIIKTKYNYAMIYALQSNVCFKKCILRGTKDEETNFSSGFYAVNGTIATFEEGNIINCDPAICSFASNVFLASAPLFENCKNKTSIGKAGNIFKTGKNEYE